MSQALASVTRRLYAEFQPDLSMAEIRTTVRQCRHDIDTVADPALPELVERLARQRLANRRQSHNPAVRRLVVARHLHPGDVVQQCDWLLHVRDVMIGQAVIAITVTEFGFPLHYGADTKVHLAACRSDQARLANGVQP